MNKTFTNRLAALLLACWLPASLAIPAVRAAEAADTVSISTTEGFQSFVKNCSLDTWSQGKTVILTADLDLTAVNFTPIPTFGGTFLGQGHTISGLRVTSAGSVQGLFRYIQPDGVVQDLNVKGTVIPAGTRSIVGGIVGDNRGTLQNCAFQGVVQGESMVGGVAGRNSETGQLIGCSSAGSVSGESATGGIAGRNLGLVIRCGNTAGVNLTRTESPVELTGVDAGAVLEERASAGDEAYHMLNSCSDTGGIVGFSSGVVQSCTNSGAVGYPHVGYNTGGIAGRQNGYLAGCANSGTVYGRKDVGGIVGQAEPYVVVDPGRDLIEELRAELNKLENLINRALDDAQRTGDDVSARLSAMGDYTGNAKDSAKDLLDRLTDFTDGTVGSVNTLLADVTNALDQLVPALDDLSDAGRRLERFSRQLNAALDDLGDAVDIGERMVREIRAALDDLQNAGNHLSGASSDLKGALEDLLQGIISGDGEATDDALDRVEGALDEMGGSFSDAADAAGDLSGALAEAEQLPESGEIASSLEDSASAFRSMASAVNSFPSLSGITLADLRNSNLDSLLEKLLQAGRNLEKAISNIQKALNRSDALSGKLGDALKDLQSATGSSAAIGRLLHRAFDTASDAIRDLVRDGPVEFTPLGEDFREASDGLYNAVGGLLDEMEGLNGALQSGNHTLTADLRAVSRQCGVVFELLLDAMGEFLDDVDEGVEAWIEDTSEEDIAATREGKVEGCRNTGTVEGDRNVGGVVGAMAIEFDLDPEDDRTDIFSLGNTYETKAVLVDSLNYGGVTGKKDCVGGLLGRMDLGTALECQNYGPVSSTGGNYVGGVTGYGDASVRSCYAKNTLSGKNYVGGIAGWASRMRDCCAIITIPEGEECLGAIAGGVEAGGVLRDNCFVDTGIAGVDGVSYAGRAEPVPFDELSQRPGVPLEFTAFTLTLMAGEETVAQIPFLYGEDLSRIDLPPVPEREGSYGEWPEFDVSGLNSDLIVEAAYAPWVTVVASQELSGKLALALAEGQFTGAAVLHVTDSAQAPPPEAGEGTAVWDVALAGTELAANDQVPLRLLNEGGGKAAVWQCRDGQWQPVEAVQNGQYLMLSMEGVQGTFCVQPQAEAPWVLLATAAAGAAALIALLAAIGKRRQKKKAAQAAAKQEEQEPAAKS